eukprot:3023471-Prymnesium_polylepis.6
MQPKQPVQSKLDERRCGGTATKWQPALCATTANVKTHTEACLYVLLVVATHAHMLSDETHSTQHFCCPPRRIEWFVHERPVRLSPVFCWSTVCLQYLQAFDAACPACAATLGCSEAEKSCA